MLRLEVEEPLLGEPARELAELILGPSKGPGLQRSQSRKDGWFQDLSLCLIAQLEQVLIFGQAIEHGCLCMANGGFKAIMFVLRDLVDPEVVPLGEVVLGDDEEDERLFQQSLRQQRVAAFARCLGRQLPDLLEL